MIVNRRSFIQRSSSLVAAASGLGTANLLIRTRASNPTLEKLRVGVVGFKGRGKGLIDAINQNKNASLVALADVDEEILRSVQSDNRSLVRTDDFRKLLDRKDVDVIASAAPNHWHAMITVLAAQAGKHVYIEKPISHNMFESRAIVAAAERYGKLIQGGFQNRSDSGLMDFFNRLNTGEFGKVKFVHGTCHRPRKSIGKLKKPLVVPKHVNYDLWLGPAAEEQILRPSLHYDWHWDFNTGNGDVGNQGPHEWDMMNWALGDGEDLPEEMRAAGNRFGWEDAGNTPNVMACNGTMNGIPFCFEVMDLRPGCKPPYKQPVGVIVETEMGRFVGGRGGGRYTSKNGKTESFKRDPANPKQDGTIAHVENFVDAVLTDDRSKLRSDCKVAAKSSSMAHMANISFQLAAASGDEELKAAFAGSEQERNMLERLSQSTEIFAKSSKRDVKETWKLGPKLTFDNASQLFKGESAADANQKMTREYRSEFLFPEVKEMKSAG